MTTRLKYDLPSTEETYEGMKLWHFFERNAKLQPKIYFDSSGLIDMLTGLNSVLRDGVFNKKLYEQPSNLVYFLAYYGMLGDIYMLPPHTEELIDTIQKNKRLFPLGDRRANLSTEELWHRLFSTKDLAGFSKELRGKAGDLDAKAFSKLYVKPYHPLIGTYLTSHGSDWKQRYKYLVKKKDIFKFSHESDYKFQNSKLVKSTLFSKLLDILNKRRPRTANNYIDALALCTLNNKLVHVEKTNVIPLFYCNQKDILQTVKKVIGEHQPKDGPKPFTYINKYEKGFEFSIVQEASFFIVDAYMNNIQNNTDDFTLDKFDTAITNIEKQIESPPASVDYTIDQAKESIEPDIADNFILEFFDHWLKENGWDDFLDLLDLKSYSYSKSTEKEVEEDISNTKREIQKRISGFGTRIQIIRRVCDDFTRFKQNVARDFQDSKTEINAFNDFGPRFCYHQNVCKKIQEWVDIALNSIERFDTGGEELLIKLQSDVISDLIDGLFDDTIDEQEKINKLAAAIGFFYSFKKYDLVNDVCTELRTQYQRKNGIGPKDKQYPSNEIALIHTGALFHGRHKEDIIIDKEAQKIIDCVDYKSKSSYITHIGLSYVYSLLWEYKIRGYRFKEEYNAYDFEMVLKSDGYEHFKKAIQYVKQAIDFLEDQFAQNKNNEKTQHRYPRYYYALNNYVFFLTFYSTKEEFTELEPFKDKLEDVASTGGIHHQEARFCDTLARYFFRSAILAKTALDFKLDIDDALHYNQRSVDAAPKRIYLALKRRINRIKQKGFQGTRRLAKRHR